MSLISVSKTSGASLPRARNSLSSLFMASKTELNPPTMVSAAQMENTAAIIIFADSIRFQCRSLCPWQKNTPRTSMAWRLYIALIRFLFHQGHKQPAYWDRRALPVECLTTARMKSIHVDSLSYVARLGAKRSVLTKTPSLVWSIQESYSGRGKPQCGFPNRQVAESPMMITVTSAEVFVPRCCGKSDRWLESTSRVSVSGFSIPGIVS